MSDNNGLDELAALARGLSPERRRELDKQLPFEDTPRISKLIVRALARVADSLEARSPEAAREVRELAAVGAARALHEEKELARIDAECRTPEFRAELEAQAKLVKAKKVPLVCVDDLLRELEEQSMRLASPSE
jgi:hypothetical protein